MDLFLVWIVAFFLVVALVIAVATAALFALLSMLLKGLDSQWCRELNSCCARDSIIHFL